MMPTIEKLPAGLVHLLEWSLLVADKFKQDSAIANRPR